MTPSSVRLCSLFVVSAVAAVAVTLTSQLSWDKRATLASSFATMPTQVEGAGDGESPTSAPAASTRRVVSIDEGASELLAWHLVSPTLPPAASSTTPLRGILARAVPLHRTSATAESQDRATFRVHVHVIGMGDSLVVGTSGPAIRKRREGRPYPVQAAKHLKALLRDSLGKSPDVMEFVARATNHHRQRQGGETQNRVPVVSISSSSEVHGFPGFHAKKILFALKKLLRATDLEETMIQWKKQQHGNCSSPLAASTLDHGALPEEREDEAPIQEGSLGGIPASGTEGMSNIVSPPAVPPGASRRTRRSSVGGGGTSTGGAQGYKFSMQQSTNESDADLAEIRSTDFLRKFGVRTLMARESRLGLLPVSAERRAWLRGLDRFNGCVVPHSSEQNDTTTTAEIGRGPWRDDGPVDLVIVVCSVFCGINDAMLGIPWWWVSANQQKLHDLCRSYVVDQLGAAESQHRRPPALVFSVPMRMLPPYYYLQEGMAAQTHRTAKKLLDLHGECEFWFRSPRRKVNLHHTIDCMSWSAETSRFPSRKIWSVLSSEQDLLAVENDDDRTKTLGVQQQQRTRNTHHQHHWCRRPTWCRGVPKIRMNISDVRSTRASRNPCVVTRTTGGVTVPTCFLQGDVLPVDQYFIFPDKQVTTSKWRSQLALWADCIHPSTLGYDTIAHQLASAACSDLEKVLPWMVAKPRSSTSGGKKE